jgi:hypothetical protein
VVEGGDVAFPVGRWQQTQLQQQCRHHFGALFHRQQQRPDRKIAQFFNYLSSPDNASLIFLAFLMMTSYWLMPPKKAVKNRKFYV